MRIFTIIFSVFIGLPILAQPNCEAYKYYGDSLKYQACITAEKRTGHYQFSREYQEALDEALAIDPTFAFAYRAKSTAYLKSGDFLTWKKLMDQAVTYDAIGQLGYRGWCRYQFFRDYRGAIEDIELLEDISEFDIGHSVNGDYHLHIARALCYKALGNNEKAIEVLEEQLKDEEHFVGIYDYIHLGVLYLEANEYEKAVECFKKQEEVNDLAENRYYISQAYKYLGDVNGYQDNLMLARDKYIEGYKMFDPYVEQADKIYLSTIEEELGN